MGKRTKEIRHFTLGDRPHCGFYMRSVTLGVYNKLTTDFGAVNCYRCLRKVRKPVAKTK